jgi:CRP/FNR family cyclic AMP-dependent transcriptional regulator
VDLSRYVKGQPLQSYKAGETIFRKGDEGKTMYVVVSGEVRLAYDADHATVVGPGASFGEMALIDKLERSASAEAVSDVEVATINQGQFLVLVHETPYFALEVMASLSERLRRANESS